MKKLVFLFLSLLTAGSLFQACDDSKTYAEMLEDEKNGQQGYPVNNYSGLNSLRARLKHRHWDGISPLDTADIHNNNKNK